MTPEDVRGWESLGTLLGIVVMGFMQYVRDRKQHIVTEKIHTLVNSNMGVQLKMVMELSEFKAVTLKTEAAEEAARVAKAKYEDHEKRQEIVDRKE